MTVDIDLTDSTAIVTGAGRGIGREICLRFADAGADVAAAARTTSEIESTVEAVESSGVDGIAVPTDLRRPDDIRALVERTVDELGTPDVLVNNAGVAITRPSIEAYERTDLETMIGVNFRGLFLLAREFGMAFRRSSLDSGGRIINIASVLGHVSAPSRTVYSGTKAGVFGLTRGLAADFADDGITVNSVSPGLIEVERIREAVENRGAEFALEEIPLRRLGRPEEIADVCLFVASPLSRYMTGADIPVDGGVQYTASLYGT